jgi:hypothetical protein
MWLVPSGRRVHSPSESTLQWAQPAARVGRNRANPRLGPQARPASIASGDLRTGRKRKKAPLCGTFRMRSSGLEPPRAVKPTRPSTRYTGGSCVSDGPMRPFYGRIGTQRTLWTVRLLSNLCHGQVVLAPSQRRTADWTSPNTESLVALCHPVQTRPSCLFACAGGANYDLAMTHVQLGRRLIALGGVLIVAALVLHPPAGFTELAAAVGLLLAIGGGALCLDRFGSGPPSGGGGFWGGGPPSGGGHHGGGFGGHGGGHG